MTEYELFFIFNSVPTFQTSLWTVVGTCTSCTGVTSYPSEKPSEPLWIYSIERTPIIKPVRGGASHTVVHKQIYLDRIAWSEEQDMWIAKEAERKWITFLTHVKANHRGASLAFPTAQIPAATVVFHLPVLVCTQAVRQPLNVFIYSEPLGEITVSCCPFFLQLSRWNLREWHQFSEAENKYRLPQQKGLDYTLNLLPKKRVERQVSPSYTSFFHYAHLFYLFSQVY